MLARRGKHQLAPVRGVEANRRLVPLRPLPARTKMLAGNPTAQSICYTLSFDGGYKDSSVF